MSVVFNPNCKYFERGGICNHSKRKTWIFRGMCILPGKECELQEEYPRPKLKPHPQKSGGLHGTARIKRIEVVSDGIEIDLEPVKKKGE